MAAGLLLLILTAGVFYGCSGSKETDPSNVPTAADNLTPTATSAPADTDIPKQKIEISIAALKGPTAIGITELMEKAEKEETENTYHFQLAGAADEITAEIVKGNIQIAAVPCNLASVLYNKTGGQVQVAAINTVSVLYIVETGEDIKSVEDLKGKTIYSTGKGTTPEYTLNYLLRAAGLEAGKDVTVEYKSEAAEVAALLAEGGDALAMLPQPYVTVAMSQNENLRIALDVAEEWEKYAQDGSSVVTGVVLVNKAFAEENKDAIHAFLEEYRASTQYVTEHVEEAAELVEKFDIIKAAVAKKAIPYCNIVFIEGEDMKQRIGGYLKALHGQDPSSVGGQLPEDDFYYVR
ncbi:MAG: ABC transporter substrate-binding protein [Lachnospiraceae bacterium]|nr:ABC transporter substrate-binding protein [Lachnospiraceae bacterium]